MNNKWDTPAYQRIASVEILSRDLEVVFEDGTTVTLDAKQVLPPDVRSPAWGSLYFNDFEIVVPTASGEIEIPWSTIRLLTDQKFAAYWTHAAEDQAKKIGRQLRKLRKSRNLTSKEVAIRAGITPQSLSRIELGHHDVVFTTLRKILAAMGCTLRDLSEAEPIPSSLAGFLKRLESVGLKREWVTDRLLPGGLLELLDTAETDAVGELLHSAATHVSRVFGWSPDALLGSDPLELNHAMARAARFKVQKRAQEVQTTAYAVYAHYLALLALQGTTHIEPRRLPSNPSEIRQAIADRYGPLTLESLLSYVWDLGIPVIPLHDSGAFHGACWRVSGRSVIVLKQVTPYQSRWSFDLAHELGHVVQHLSEEQEGVIETVEISPFEDDSDEEWEASEFASDLLLFGRAEELAEMSVEFARNEVRYLKSAVLRVAAAEHVPVDVLSNYLAYRLSRQNINWWGAANNLQIKEPSPLEVAREFFLARVDLESLTPGDRELMVQALK